MKKKCKHYYVWYCDPDGWPEGCKCEKCGDCFESDKGEEVHKYVKNKNCKLHYSDEKKQR